MGFWLEMFVLLPSICDIHLYIYVCMYVMTKCSNVKHVYMNKSPVLNKVAVNLVVMAMSDEGEVWLWELY